LGRDVFQRGDPEPIEIIKRPQWSATLYDLLSAYASQRQRHALAHVRVAKREVWSLAEAREVLTRLVGGAADWSRLDEFLLSYAVEPSMIPTVLASSFAASLELAREGRIELHQQGAFAPLFLRQRTAPAEPAPAGAV
jgi:segregation and condensation protein A